MIKNVVEIYEFVVMKIESEDSFWVRMFDFDGVEMEAEMITSKVLLNKEDLNWLKRGAYGHWIFYNNETSDFKFTKEFWTQEDLNKARKWAEKVSKYFKELPKVQDG